MRISKGGATLVAVYGRPYDVMEDVEVEGEHLSEGEGEEEDAAAQAAYSAANPYR